MRTVILPMALLAMVFTFSCDRTERPEVRRGTTNIDKKSEPLPVAPMPREKEIRCTCFYCSCMTKPLEDEKPFKCVCNEKRCKDTGCLCNKWKKK